MVRFYKSDIFAWDEGLFALRAKGILINNQWWDQTTFSPGGLYSSTYPPLNSWMIAISMKFLGESEFSVRLFSSLCAILFLAIFYKLSLLFLNQKYSLISCIFLSSNLIWNMYTRQGMSDIPLLAMILLSLYSILKIKNEQNYLIILGYALLIIISIYAGLMLKIVKSLLPFLFVLIFIFQQTSLRKKIIVILASLIAIALAFPWYYYMIKTYGNLFTNALFPPHIFNIIEGNTRFTGFFYYVNQFIISSPFLITIFFLMIIYIYKFNMIKEFINFQNISILIYPIVWFFITFFAFSFSQTKMPNYTLYIIPPAILLISYFLENDKLVFNRKELHFLYILWFLSLFWYFSPNIRESLKTINFKFELLDYIIIIISFFTIFVFGFWGDKLSKNIKKENIKTYNIYLISAILIYRIFLFNFINYNDSNASGIMTGKFIKDNLLHDFIYLYHQHNYADSLNPQLGWYTNGQLYGWIKGKKYTPISIPENKIDLKSIKKTDSLPFLYLIYAVSDKNSISSSIIYELSQTREILYKTKDYIIFGKRKKIRKENYI